VTVQGASLTAPPPPARSYSARFISRGRLTARALYWLGWLTFSRRSVVTSGVEREVYVLGIGALRLVAASSLLVGLIAIFQVAAQLAPYGAEPISPRVVTWFAARELGPVVVALLIVARSSAAIAGELASMNATGEIDALRAMGLDPVKYLVSPKLLAVIIVLPALTIISDALILGGVWIGSTVFLGYSTDRFASQIREAFLTRDLGVGIGKSIIFALIIAIIASDEGLSADRRAAGIGAAATRAVVFSLIIVLGADTFVNAIFYFIPGLI
jgi:phospholipid/cholesterol/gamma-HCH transport system permease protein